MNRGLGDIALGVRLAVGGGRTSLARFVLSTIGITIAVAVLLLASSVDNAVAARDQRLAALAPNTTPVPGVDPLTVLTQPIDLSGRIAMARYLYAGGPRAPIPPGLTRLPAQDEAFVSPGLADLLNSAQGQRLRSRIPPVTGTIDESGIANPGELILYIGADQGLRGSRPAGGPLPDEVYSFGQPAGSRQTDPGVLLFVLLGVVALLVPVFVFVAASMRIAGAERDRRLSALRLAGAGSRQVRRIAAAESVVSALAALPLGAAVFLLSRPVVSEFEMLDALFGVRALPGDIVPAAWGVVLIVLAIPALAVLTAQFALRRTIIEPLGVLRHRRPVRRRLWWRLGLVTLGVVLLLTHGGTDSNDVLWSYAVAAGAALTLIGVPVLLPWLVERVVRRIRGGPASWQLAIRRLQVDSGTSARVVGGVTVVLAGVIALDAVLLAQEERFGSTADAMAHQQVQRTLVAMTEPDVTEAVGESLAGVPGVRTVYTVGEVSLKFDDGNTASAGIADCADVNRMLRISDCADGQVFLLDQGNPEPSPYPPGRTLTFRQYSGNAEWDVGQWTVPAAQRHFPAPTGPSPPTNLVITPGALGGVTPPVRPNVIAEFDDRAPAGTGELAQGALAPFGWRADGYVNDSIPPEFDIKANSLATVRDAVLAGAVLVLLVAGVSLLAMALEQIRERRRALAILAANGVPRRVLARSLLWQTVVPVALGVLLATVIGLGLAALALRLANPSDFADLAAFRVSWANVGVLAGAAFLVALLMTALTLPFLRGAIRPESLRTE